MLLGKIASIEKGQGDHVSFQARHSHCHYIPVEIVLTKSEETVNRWLAWGAFDYQCVHEPERSHSPVDNQTDSTLTELGRSRQMDFGCEMHKRQGT
jgi:hypothetical protein